MNHQHINLTGVTLEKINDRHYIHFSLTTNLFNLPEHYVRLTNHSSSKEYVCNHYLLRFLSITSEPDANVANALPNQEYV